MEKELSLTFGETSALLEMSVCSFAKSDEGSSASALTKLAYLYRDFVEDQRSALDSTAPDKLPRAA